VVSNHTHSILFVLHLNSAALPKSMFFSVAEHIRDFAVSASAWQPLSSSTGDTFKHFLRLLEILFADHINTPAWGILLRRNARPMFLKHHHFILTFFKTVPSLPNLFFPALLLAPRHRCFPLSFLLQLVSCSCFQLYPMS